MSDFSSYFMDPCELVAIVYDSDGITELGRYSLRGYAKSMNRFFQICTLFTWEMSYLIYFMPNAEISTFKTFANVLRSDFYWEVRKEKNKILKVVVQQYIEELKQYQFKSQRIFPFLAESDATYLNRKEYEITIDRIFKWILKMRQYHISFYEDVLQEYRARKDQYNQQLREYLDKNEQILVCRSTDLDVASILNELGADTVNQKNNGLFDRFYQISNQSWYLADLLKLDNPEIERYTKGLPRYRTRSFHVHPEGLKAFFELFTIFRDEMKFILPDETDKHFFERVLTVLKRDFLYRFEERGDLEETIIEYIENLEKYIFLSLSKEQFFNRLSRMIYGLRTRRIEYYEAVLADYLANKEKYDAIL